MLPVCKAQFQPLEILIRRGNLCIQKRQITGVLLLIAIHNPQQPFGEASQQDPIDGHLEFMVNALEQFLAEVLDTRGDDAVRVNPYDTLQPAVLQCKGVLFDGDFRGFHALSFPPLHSNYTIKMTGILLM